MSSHQTFWKPVDKMLPWGSTHYRVFALERDADGIRALRTLFPDGKANYMNVVLFSTSGIHGHYLSIEEVAKELGEQSLTFLVLHPRTVTVRYGNCMPQTADDIKFLKRLRRTSKAALAQIGSA